MAHFRKKPVVIEAVRAAVVIANATNDWKAMPSWIRDAYEAGDIVFAPRSVSIRTLEGMMTANPEDWIIRGVAGEIYPCKPDIFEKTYDQVPE